jgi:hypothetical protein
MNLRLDSDKSSRRGKGLQRALPFALSAVVALCFVQLLLLSPVSARPKTDVVILANGDQLTGEVKGLQSARLEFKTDTMETVYIKWEEVEQVSSEYSFQVELESGVRFFGTLGVPAESGMLSVVGIDGTVGLNLEQVVFIRPIKQQFWKRIDGSFSLGLSFTKASDVLRFSLNATPSTRRRRTSWLRA